MIIYKVTNSINNKVYVGQTIRSIEKRWANHCCKSIYKSCPALSNAIQKHGKENFTITEIDGANAMDELNYLENFYVHKFNSLAPNGYNLREGGGARCKHSKINRKKQLNAQDNLSKTFNIYEITRDNKKNSSSIKYKVLEVKKIGSYNNQTKCSRDFNILQGSINNCLKNKVKFTNKYIFVYEDEKIEDKIDKINKKEDNYCNGKLFNVYRTTKNKDFKNIYIGSWNNQTRCCKETNLCNKSISACFNGKIKSYKGYTFKYEDVIKTRSYNV